MSLPTESDLIDQILLMSEEAWENRVTRAPIQTWLENFEGRELPADQERLHALHLLSHFTYFGQSELRQLLIALFRDLFQYPLVQEIRATHHGTRDEVVIGDAFRNELHATRFLGMGNPSESGSHLLYYFRQENELHKDLFVSPHQVLSGQASDPNTVLLPPDLKRLVFIDDVLGSGQQAEEYSRSVLADVRQVALREGRTIDIWYLVLFAKQGGLNKARRTAFDVVSAVHELDASQEAYSTDSFVFSDATWTPTRVDSERFARGYGRPLFPNHELGYRDGQLLLGLHHNVPDNTLPIFWNDENVLNWQTLFKRFPKDVKW